MITAALTGVGMIAYKAVSYTHLDVYKRQGINLSALERFEDGAEVSVEALIEAGIVKNPRDGVKILGNGELTKKLNVKANAFSASAKEKIEALGGKAEVI